MQSLYLSEKSGTSETMTRVSRRRLGIMYLHESGINQMSVIPAVARTFPSL